MSVLHRKKGQAEEALRFLDDPRCLPLLERLDEHRWYHYGLHNRGEALRALGRLLEARELFERCLPYFKGQKQGHHDRLWEAKTLRELGVVLHVG